MIVSMPRLDLRSVAWAVVAATVAFEVAAWLLSWGLEPRYDTILYALYAVVQAVAGALIVSRHPRHPIGWLFLWFALLNAVVADALQGWGLRAAQTGWPAGPLAEWLALNSWIAASVGLILTFLLFPDGRLPAPRWRLVVGANVLGIALTLPGWALSPGLGDEFAAGRNPFAVPSLPTTLLFVVGNVLICGALVASVAALVVRFRRSHGVERQQMKWFTFAAALVALALPVGDVLWSVVPAARVLPALALTTVPVAACVAILRYRLYDIDLVISRTLAYGALTLALALAYVASALLLGTAVGSRSAWATAGATLVVAVAFRPLRDRIQGVVDRRFDRARAEARNRVLHFVEELRQGRVEPEDIEDVLRDALGDAGLEVRLRLPDGSPDGSSDGALDALPGVLGGAPASSLDVDLRGRPVPMGSGDDPDGRVRVPVRRGGVVVGDVLGGAAHEGPPPPTDVIEVAALPIEIARLRVELRRQLDEVRRSRARLVAVAEEERRRLERDLHDGAQQRLVAIGLALRHAQHLLQRPDGTAAVQATLEGAIAEITGAIEELRELARGVRPGLLDAGLGPALHELAARAPLPVEVRVDVDVPGRRFSAELEAAAYFVACEGLTNAVKHARAAKVSLTVAGRDGAIVVRVADDGVGGARPGAGTGLTGLSDRVVAHGGTLRIDTAEGRGTTLIASLPCGS
jgi:signal transduction histidine kinase